MSTPGRVIVPYNGKWLRVWIDSIGDAAEFGNNLVSDYSSDDAIESLATDGALLCLGQPHAAINSMCPTSEHDTLDDAIRCEPNHYWHTCVWMDGRWFGAPSDYHAPPQYADFRSVVVDLDQEAVVTAARVLRDAWRKANEPAWGHWCSQAREALNAVAEMRGQYGTQVPVRMPRLIPE